MRALTVRQPWASLILAGLKTIETRSARTKRRGRVYLHAGSTMGKAEREAAIREGFDPDTLPRGAIIGSIEIVDAVRAEDLVVSDAERSRGDYRAGRWGWKVANVRALSTPVAASGALSFWSVPPDIAQAAEDQLKSDGPARVFVYGTLKRGGGNHRLLEASGARFLGNHQIAGTMHDYGAFPAVTLDGSGTVHGEVYEVSTVTLERLDRLEGTPSFYQRARVSMSTGMDAWVYVMDAARLATKMRIASGRWEKRW